MVAELKLDTRQLHGGLYVVREHSVSHELLRPARRLPRGDHAVSTDSGRSFDYPKLVFRVNDDDSMTVDTGLSRRGLGVVSFPLLRREHAETFSLGADSVLADFTIKPSEEEAMAILFNTNREHLHQTRIIYVAPKHIDA